MIEFDVGDEAFFRFSNRQPVAGKDGLVEVFRVPSARVLLASRGVDFLVLIVFLAGFASHADRFTYSAVLLGVQVVHAAVKVRTWWRPVRVERTTLQDPRAARQTLQFEHTSYLTTVCLILPGVMGYPPALLFYASAVLLLVVMVAMFRTLRPRRVVVW
ncbi:hypothetical protein KPL74_05925 [Bacillus sp. NP157]|nr:hypothetical protein KPL74_05925 [Bacillus sp. NP157]